MFAFWFNFWRKRRIAHYRERQTSKPVNVFDAKNITQQLADTWREIYPPDLLNISGQRQAVITLQCWTKNLPELIDTLAKVNHCITQEADGQLESLIDSLREQRRHTLDFYLADENNNRIDEVTALTRLRGLLQEHHFILRNSENQYYQRLTTKLYQDVATLTSLLISLTG